MSKHRKTQVRVTKASSDRNAASARKVTDRNTAATDRDTASTGRNAAAHKPASSDAAQRAKLQPRSLLSAAEATAPSRAASSEAAAASSPDVASVTASVAGFFEIRDALEHLRAELIDVEALALAAGEAADHLPSGTTPSQRLRFGRLQSLATEVAHQASECLEFASEQVTRFASAS